MHSRIALFLGSALLLATTVASPARAALAPDLWASTPLSPPNVRNGHSGIVDPLRNRLVVFGGNSGTAALNDGWALDLTTHTWTGLATTGTKPAARYKHVAIYDQPRDRMVIFGGYNGASLFNDTWALNLSTLVWTQLTTTGTVPSKRARHSAVFNPSTGTMVVFGGYNGTSTFNDLYTLNLTTLVWTKVTAGGTLPEARQGQSSIYDSVHGSMVMFGGNGAVTTLLNDTWSLNLATNTWTKLTPSGSLPNGRFDHAAAYDASRGQMVVYGGQTTSTVFRGDTWGLNLSTNAWTQLSTTGPSARTRPALVYDTTHDAAVLFGGQATTGSLNDVWTMALSGTTWTAVAGSGTTPPPTLDYSVAWDPQVGGSIFFGGWTGTIGTENNNTYVLNVSGGATTSMTWNAMAATNKPAPRFGHAGIYDSVTNQYLIYGGFLGQSVWSNELWSLNPSTGAWTQINYGTPSPTPLAGVGAVFDAVGRRMIVFGGTTTGGGYVNDCWAYNIDSNRWTQVGVSGPRPAARGGNAAISDDAHGRMLIWSGASDVGYFNDTWALNYSTDTWQQLVTTGTPAGRGSIAPAYDAAHNRMIAWGGQSSLGGLSNETNYLDLSTLAWTTETFAAGTVPSARASIWASYDPVRNWMVVWGGNDPGATNAGGILYNSADALAPVARVTDATQRASSATPASFARPATTVTAWATGHRVTLRVTLAEAARVAMTIVGVDGRVVARDIRGVLPAGQHAWVSNGIVPPGVYFVRVEAGGQRIGRKVMVF